MARRDLDVRVTTELAVNVRQQLVDAALPQMRRWARDIKADMERAVPIDTGHLQSTIFVELDESSGEITGGASAEYAAPVEFGHVTASGSHVPPQPFIRPAFLRRR